jgi:hypothetical protein
MSGIFLLALLFTVGIACAADTDANLSVSKVVTSAAPYITGQPVTWKVTLTNEGPADATNISLSESGLGFTGPVDITGVADLGLYDNATRFWNISQLNNATSANLTIVTVFGTAGDQTNNVDIVHLDQTSYGTSHASASIHVVNNTEPDIPNLPLSVKLTIRPNTLNLGSKGVFTVFITLYGGESPFPLDGKNKPRIDYANSSLNCSGADMISAGTGVSNKDGGTLIAKFHRQDLENVTSGPGVQVNCSGTLVVNGKSVDIEGSDTIRVIGEKKGMDKFISGLMKYLGLEKDDIAVTETGDGNVTLSVTLNPDMFKNNGQVKKAIGTKEDASPNKGQNATDKTTGQNQNALKNNGKDNNNNGKDDNVQQNDSDNNDDKGNKNAGKGNDASQGKANGKKDK